MGYLKGTAVGLQLVAIYHQDVGFQEKENLGAARLVTRTLGDDSYSASGHTGPQETEGLQKPPGTAEVTCLPDAPPRDGSWAAWVTCWPEQTSSRS